MTDERAKEVVGKLRRLAKRYRLWSKTSARKADRERDAAEGKMYREAADELERLREALKPFADAWKILFASNQNADGVMTAYVSDCKRAAELLK